MIELRAVDVTIGGAEVLARVDLSVGAGERVALLGANGAGKSTLLDVVAGLRVPDRGSVRVLGGAPPVRGLGFLPQDAGGSLLPWLRVRDNAALPLRIRGERDDALELAARRADPDGTIDLDAFPSALSGGQRQRVALMRAIAGPPRALVFDEPLSAIDAASRPRLRAMLRELCRAHAIALLVATHDPADVRELGARIVRLERGRIVRAAGAA